jgi:hypothetical protein
MKDNYIYLFVACTASATNMDNIQTSRLVKARNTSIDSLSDELKKILEKDKGMPLKKLSIKCISELSEQAFNMLAQNQDFVI